MTTLTLKSFAQKLGFKRASNARFQTLLKQWSIEGAVKVYQGGYRGHSTKHPKKAQLLKSVEFYEENSKRKQFNILDAKPMLEELGLKLKHSSRTSAHQCSNCKGGIIHETVYATASLFLIVKLCPHCIKAICEGGKLSIRPEVKIT